MTKILATIFLFFCFLPLNVDAGYRVYSVLYNNKTTYTGIDEKTAYNVFNSYKISPTDACESKSAKLMINSIVIDTFNRPTNIGCAFSITKIPVQPFQSVILTSCGYQDDTQIFNLINNYRKTNGLNQLKLNCVMSRAAYNHSVWMTLNKTMDHYETPGTKGYTGTHVTYRCNYTGYYCNFENIAYNTYNHTPEQFFKQWKESAPHNATMLNPTLKEIGIASNDIYSTTVFRN